MSVSFVVPAQTLIVVFLLRVIEVASNLLATCYQLPH
jgi:hypothetical protein